MGVIETCEAKDHLSRLLTHAAHQAARRIGKQADAVLKTEGLDAGRKLLQLSAYNSTDESREIAALCSALHEYEAIVALVETQPSGLVTGPTIDLQNADQYDQSGGQISHCGLRGAYRILADHLLYGGLHVCLELKEDNRQFAVMNVRS